MLQSVPQMPVYLTLIRIDQDFVLSNFGHGNLLYGQLVGFLQHGRFHFRLHGFVSISGLSTCSEHHATS